MEGDFDMDSAVAGVAEGLGLGEGSDDHDTTDNVQASLPLDETDSSDSSDASNEAAQESEEGEQSAEPKVEAKPAPKSWAKDTHELWAKLPPEAQAQIEKREQQILAGLEQYKEHNEFGRTVKDVMTPYKAYLNSMGVDEVKAISYLMNANYKLTQGAQEQRVQAYRDLGKQLGLIQQGEQVEEQQVDPRIKSLDERFSKIETSLTAREQAEFQATKERVAKDVDAFASSPDHPYFDDVADDIAKFIGIGMSLEDAYKKAVWANDVTREKELARIQTESKKNLLGKSKQEAEAARKAASTNVKGRDTTRAPTESLGTMEDTMKATLKSIQQRTH